MPSAEQLEKGFRIGDWEVLPARGVLRCADDEQRPEPLVLRVLLALARRDGDLVTRDQLIEEIWDGRPIGDEPINRCLSQLRGHLGDKSRPHQYIETLTKRGYRLAQPVQLMRAEESVGVVEDKARRLGNQGRLWVFAAVVIVTVLIGVFVRVGPTIDEIESIGVLPFDNLSGDAADQYRVRGFKVELVNTLSNIPGVAVKHGRVDYPGREVGEIAGILGVDYVLSGELQRVGEDLKVTYRVERGENGATISSGEVTGKVGEEFQMQGTLAVLVRDDLVGESPQTLISANRNPDSAAFDRYMLGLDLFERRGRGSLQNLDSAIALFEESIDIDPGFGPAYLSLATAYALLPDYRQSPLEETHARALQLAEQAVEVDPALQGASSAIVGFVHHKRREWVRAENAYQRATTADIVDSNAFNWYSLMLARVGRLDASLEQILIAHKMDPSSAVINSRVGIVYSWRGDSDKAAGYFEAAEQLGASGEVHLLGHALQLLRQGHYAEATKLVTGGLESARGNTAWVGPVIAAIADPGRRSAALVALDEAMTTGFLDPRLDIFSRVMLADVDGAMAIAMEMSESDSIFEMDMMFLPELRPLREHPDFMRLMEQNGVTAYWHAKGCRWGNDRVTCAD